MNKKIFSIVAVSFMCFLLSACGAKKTVMNISFADYTLAASTNGKTYISLPPDSLRPSLLYQAIQVGTGASWSLLVAKASFVHGTTVQEIITSNHQQLKQKLSKYKGSAIKAKNVSCAATQLSWYYMNFSYEDTPKHTLFVYQYFFASGSDLYVLSLQTNASRDVSALSQSIKTLTCQY